MDWKEHYKNDTHPLVWPDIPVVRLVNKLNLKKGAEALDIACGEGRNTRLLVEKGYKVTGIDQSEHALSTLGRLYNVDKSNLLVGDAILTLKKIQDESFELVLCWGFLHFMKQNEITALLQEIYRILKKDAHLIISFTSTNDLRNSIFEGHSFFSRNDAVKILEDACMDISNIGLTENTFFQENKIESFYWALSKKK